MADRAMFIGGPLDGEICEVPEMPLAIFCIADESFRFTSYVTVPIDNGDGTFGNAVYRVRGWWNSSLRAAEFVPEPI